MILDLDSKEIEALKITLKTLVRNLEGMDKDHSAESSILNKIKLQEDKQYEL